MLNIKPPACGKWRTFGHIMSQMAKYRPLIPKCVFRPALSFWWSKSVDTPPLDSHLGYKIWCLYIVNVFDCGETTQHVFFFLVHILGTHSWKLVWCVAMYLNENGNSTWPRGYSVALHAGIYLFWRWCQYYMKLILRIIRPLCGGIPP